jgi:6,7-dimethyl-8-ribityllumazine synthase
MLEGALDALKRHGASEEQIDIARVPGTWEIPVATQKMVTSGRHDTVIGIGRLFRGSTAAAIEMANLMKQFE